jgi:hypothetical protein
VQSYINNLTAQSTTDVHSFSVLLRDSSDISVHRYGDTNVHWHKFIRFAMKEYKTYDR